MRRIPRWLILADFLAAIVYLSWWFLPGHKGEPHFYYLLVAGEIYHVIMAMTFWYTVSGLKISNNKKYSFMNDKPAVDIFITVCGEPYEIVEETVRAAKKISYKNKHIYILNDGFVAKKSNWREMEELARREKVVCITRKIPGGAKAGNINNAIKITNSPYIAMFDADHVPKNEFLSEIMPIFANSKSGEVGFVQTPQYYKNWQENGVTKGSWSQQEFFFGPIMEGKDAHNAAFMCGTNMVISREALKRIGGMDETSIAEDIVTSQKMQAKGYRSVYVPKILAEGLAPLDMEGYVKQQYRWARGAVGIILPVIFRRGLSIKQRIEYLSSALYFLNGLVVGIDVVLPLVFFFTGVQVVAASTFSFAIFFLPFITLTLYTLSLLSNGSLTFAAVSYAQSLWLVQIKAFLMAILGTRAKFSVTPKRVSAKSQFRWVWPHVTYMILCEIGVAIAIQRQGLDAAVFTNIAWAFLNCALFWPFIVEGASEKKEQNRDVVVSTGPAF